MGQSTVVATAFTAIMFVAGVSILVMSTVHSFDTLSQAITARAETSDLMLSERVEFGDWSLIDSSTLLINTSNIGSTSIHLNRFNTIDMILSYNDGASEKTSWITYDQTESSSSYWNINRVFFRNQQQDLINPISLNGSTSGAWDPEETIELEIHLDEATPEFEYITMITPAGVQVHSSLTKLYDMGYAIIPNGTGTLEVSHLLDRVPDNVQLTPASSIDTSFWVELVDSDSFTINLSVNATSDIGFYWRVE